MSNKEISIKYIREVSPAVVKCSQPPTLLELSLEELKKYLIECKSE